MATATLADGKLLRRGDAGYEPARRDAVWRANIPPRFPRAIVLCETVDDVVAGVNLARAEGLRIGVRSGGHSWTSPHLREGSLLLDLSRMRDVRIDPDRRVIRAEPGAKGRVANKALEAHGLMGAFGHHDTVGVGGFTLCGGFGWNAREWGNGCTNVLAVEVVNAAGERLHCDATTNSDYYWAARGSGAGFFAVVVAFWIQVYRRPALTHCAYSVHLDGLQPLLAWTHAKLAHTPRHVEMIASSGGYDAEGAKAPTRTTVSALAFTDTAEQGKADLDALFADFPLFGRTIFAKPATPATLDERYDSGTKADPAGYRYACDNLYSDAPAADILPLMDELFGSQPTPRTHVFWQNWGPVRPLPDMAFSVQGNLYLGAYTIWDDPAQDAAMTRWPVEQMRRLEGISTGEGQMNDENMAGRSQRYLSVAAAARLERYRAAHDPGGLFLSYLTLDGGETV